MMPTTHFDTHPEGQMKFTTEMNNEESVHRYKDEEEDMDNMQGVYP